jgi:hypothetical protein
MIQIIHQTIVTQAITGAISMAVGVYIVNIVAVLIIAIANLMLFHIHMSPIKHIHQIAKIP